MAANTIFFTASSSYDQNSTGHYSFITSLSTKSKWMFFVGKGNGWHHNDHRSITESLSYQCIMAGEHQFRTTQYKIRNRNMYTLTFLKSWPELSAIWPRGRKRGAPRLTTCIRSKYRKLRAVARLTAAAKEAGYQSRSGVGSMVVSCPVLQNRTC